MRAISGDDGKMMAGRREASWGRWVGLLMLAASVFVTGCSTVQPARRTSAKKQPAAAGPQRVVSSRPPGPRAPVMQITAPQSAWRAESERWYGTPYRLGGNDANGLDCSGYTSVLYHRVAGMNLPRTSAQQFKVGRTVGQDDLRPGDLVFFRGPNGRDIEHVGVYLGSSYFTHASASRGVTYNSMKERYYRGNYIGGRRVVGG